MSDTRISTFTARVPVTPEQHAFLGGWGDLHGQAERLLAQPVLHGEAISTSHATYKSIRDRLQLSDRNANAALIAAQGKVDASIAGRERQILELDGKIKRAEQVLRSGKIHGRKMTALQQHHKQRRLDRLRNRRRSAEASGPKLCFGSRKLFHAQFDLEANGYKDHSDWQKDWRVARAGEIYIVGRNSEPAGNLTCQASIDGSAFSLSLRVPPALEAQFRAGVEVIAVNPAWTSVIGSVNDAARFGLSVHLAAAVAIARRGLSFSETPAGAVVATPIRGGHVTFLLPERNRRKHVWSFWAEVSSARKAARASAFPVAKADDGHLRGAYEAQRG